jgi:hypothetical protein
VPILSYCGKKRAGFEGKCDHSMAVRVISLIMRNENEFGRLGGGFRTSG